LIKKLFDIFLTFWSNQFIKFLVIGALNTVFGYSVFALLIYCKIHYSISLLLATIIGVIFNFKTIGGVVFKDNKNNKIFKFITVYTVLYILNLAIVFVLKNIVMNIYISGAIAALPIACIGFYLNKRFVFCG